MVGQSVQKGGCHFGIGEHGWPFSEGKVGCQQNGCAFVEFADEMQDQAPAGVREWEIAEFVNDHEINAGQLLARPASLAIAMLGQKCRMDNPDAIAMDLRGNVMTCQNTGAKEEYKIGHVTDFDDIALDTATHFAFRTECMACPVVQLCKSSCMFLDGDFFARSCANEFAFNSGS